MKVIIIYGVTKKGCTYHIAQEVLSQLAQVEEVKEVFLPKDAPEYCHDCTQCFSAEKPLCCTNEKTNAILEQILWADLIIMTSPVYVYHATAAIKNLLDHYGNIWMVHRPQREMFKKQAILIATAAGGGMKTTIQDMKDSVTMWGVAHVETVSVALFNTDWDKVTVQKRQMITKKVTKAAKRINRNQSKDKIRVNFKTKAWFYLVRFMQSHMALNPPDRLHWEKEGWLGKERPWKSSSIPEGGRHL